MSDIENKITQRIKELNAEIALLKSQGDEASSFSESEYIAHLNSFEETITNISSEFYGLFDTDLSIIHVLGYLGSWSGAERSFLLYFNDNNKIINVAHEWCKKEILHKIHDYRNFTIQEEDSFVVDQLLKNDFCIINKKEHVEADNNISELFDILNADQLILYPIIYDGGLKGAVGLVNPNLFEEWRRAYNILLKITAKTFRLALYGKKADQNSKHIAKSAKSAILIISESKVLFSNIKAEELTGYEVDELVGEPFKKLIHPEEFNKVLSFHKEVLRSVHKNNSCSFQFLQKNGTSIWVEMIANNITFEGQSASLASIKDITDKKTAEEALNESNRRLSTLISNLPGIVYRCKHNETRTMEFMSEGTIIATGFEPQHFINDLNSSYVDIVFEEDKEYVLASIDNAIKQRAPFLLKYRIKSKDGEIRWVKENGTGVFSQSGNLIAIEGFISDITDTVLYETTLKSAKEKAEKADMLKTTFLANMSHEIRTPMNAIIGFSNLLNDPDLTSDQRGEYLNYINNSSSVLLKLINDIIDITKIEAGQIKIVNGKCSLHKLLQELYEAYEEEKSETGKKDIKLSLKYNIDDDIIFLTDTIRLRQVMSNLIDNALKYTHEGEIEFGVSVEENDIKFYVKDTGIGIPEDQLKSIFKRFWQVDDSSTRKYGGTGLGLSICRSLTKLLGCDIWAESKLNEGSVFYLTIPYNPLFENKDGDAARAINIDEYSWEKVNLLIVEDDDTNYRFLYEALKNTGINMTRAKDGAKALEYAQTHDDIDTILMDIQLPVMDGYEATKRIKTIKPEIPIIAQTAYAMINEREKCIKAGCDEYIAKPIKPRDLLELLSKFIEVNIK